MKPIIEISHISKKYRLGERQLYFTLRDALTNSVKGLPRLFRGQIKTDILKKGEFWALKDVSFRVDQGEAVGVIGSNGAGKSTLLKVLSRITPPTLGRALLKGSVSSLLDVGTGFHLELTGRENIYLNGAILGMTRKEIDRKFDAIVEFSEIQRFLDTPVKHYSSGMYLRLAFSVAAHLEPDILIVDEVLAVGDTLFQQKCLGKMNEVTKEYGRTVLFVSHDMNAIQNLCKRSILLDKGRIISIGPTDKVIKTYLKVKSVSGLTSGGVYSYPKISNKRVQIRKVIITNSLGKIVSEIEKGKIFNIDIEYDVNETTVNTYLGISCIDERENPVFFSSDVDNNKQFLSKRSQGKYRATFSFPKKSTLFLNKGRYYFKLAFGHPGYSLYDEVPDITINVVEPTIIQSFLVTDIDGRRPGPIVLDTKWKSTKI